MSRAPLPYSSRILELFKNPKNAGKMADATVSAEAGSPVCGDIIAIYLKIENDAVISRASFESYGCAANIATASMLTEMVKGKRIEEAWKIGWKEVAEEVGGLPAVKFHCGVLAVGALRRAVREYFRLRSPKPAWLPEQDTFEEKQALDEENLAKELSRRLNASKDRSDSK